MKMRRCTCFDCKCEWDAPVKPAGPFCPNISDEATNFCIKCNSRNVQSGPVFDYTSPSDRLIDTLKASERLLRGLGDSLAGLIHEIETNKIRIDHD